MDDPVEGPAQPARRGDRLVRRCTPAGFLLALLLFVLLPGVAASCDIPASTDEPAGTLSAAPTGADLIGGRLAVEGTGGYARVAELLTATFLDVAPTLSTVLAVATAATMGLGAAVILVPRLRGNATIAVLVSAAALALLVATAVSTAQILAGRAGVVLLLARDLPVLGDRDLSGRVGEVISTRPGLWLTSGVLLLVLAANVAVHVRHRPATRR